ncbi:MULTISPECIES: capsid protein [unclassified Marinobacter]|uniref:capsid protein n=1 Tax=unclassified Marinobacter TaxID=83889 RepID=UPI001267F151|nr:MULTISPECIES: capsid protein [unclassified Marinobacter]QFS87592.1 hypothetical protein FIV08_12235 [Marinobacter sp. THAF197a]QFT51377.1 hypothetical protein FIU96_12150 [Marinobacter sp. THAF39]
MVFPVDQAISQSGQINKAGDSRALFLKLFAGEVLTMFRTRHIAMGLTRVRTIKNGKSASFPLIGKNTAKYHTPGKLIETNKIGHAERIVTIDDIAISPVFIPDIQEAISHYDVRSQYSTECAEALAGLVDRNIFRMIAKAGYITSQAEAVAAGLKVLPEETYSQNIMLAAAGDEFEGAALVDALFRARTQLRKQNIYKPGHVVFGPEQIEALTNIAQGQVNAITWLNKDVNGSVNPNMEGTGPVARIAGFTIYESNNLPNQNETAGLVTDPEPLSDVEFGSGNAAKYRGNYSNIIGLAFTEDAVATTKLMDLQVRNVDEPLRLGETVLAKLAVGHDMLRPGCSVNIEKYHV